MTLLAVILTLTFGFYSFIKMTNNFYVPITRKKMILIQLDVRNSIISIAQS